MYGSHLEYLERHRSVKTLQRLLLTGLVFIGMFGVLGVVAWVGLSGLEVDMGMLMPPAPAIVQ